MSRFSRLSIILAGLGLTAALGLTACERVPLLAPTGTVINLTLASDVAALNSSVDVIAVLIENGGTSGTGTGTSSSTTAAGTPVQNGTVVSFTTTIGTIEPAEAKTQNGRVNVKLVTGGQSGKATITAYSGGAKSTAQITIGAAAVDHILTTASPANLSSSGGSTTISARVEDVSGNGLVGIPVQFTSTKGTLSASTVNTNSNGVATTTLSTTVAADVTATVGAKTSKVTVNVATRASVTVTGPTSTVSISAPASFTVNVGTTVPVTNVTVSYGDGQSRQLGTFSGTQTVSHFYSTSGIFDVTVSATDPDGIVTTATTQIAITNLTGTMTSSAATAQRGVTVITFTASVLPSGASIDHYVWEFDDGTGSVTSFGNTQTHVFSSGTPAGIKTVQVTVFPLYGASFKITLQITVTV